MPSSSSSIKKIKAAQIALTCLGISASSDPPNHYSNNYINKQIYEHKTNAGKQHLEKIDHRHNPTPSMHCSKAIQQKTTYTTE